MSAYCICDDCTVADMKTGRTPDCFADVDRDGDGLANLLAYIAETGEEGFDIRDYMAHRRSVLGLPADPREEWKLYLETRLASGALSSRQINTAQTLLALI